MAGGDVRFQVFISSTYEDLREERQQATQAILTMGHLPAGMELFPASDLSQTELIKRVIDESDYYLVIVGGRYGSLGPDGVSFTEMEYDYACQTGIPILGFTRRSPDEIARKFSEVDPEKAKKLEAFRRKVHQKHCRHFDDPKDLGMLVMQGLMSEIRLNPRIGYVRADKARSTEDVDRERELLRNVSDLEKTVKKLQRRLRDGRTAFEDEQWNEALPSLADSKSLTVLFKNRDKSLSSETIEFTWGEIFALIAPSMYGFLLKRGNRGYNRPEGYAFEEQIVQKVRIRDLEKFGQRQIDLLPNEIDAVLVMFRQMGLIEYRVNREDEKDEFRGLTLTEHGEMALAKLTV